MKEGYRGGEKPLIQPSDSTPGNGNMVSILQSDKTGFPDRCSSYGGPILSPWHDYYRFAMLMGLTPILSGPLLIEGTIENDDALRFNIGALSLALGVYVVFIGIILWHRGSLKTEN